MKPTERRNLLATLLAAIATIARASTNTHAKDNRTMSSAPLEPNKRPQPPQSTLDFRDHAANLRLFLSVVYTGQADQDFAALLAVQRKGLLDLARLELQHGADPEMRAIAQRMVENAAAEDAALQAWQARQAG